MLKSSLLEILRTFSRQELIKFEDFVRSPYFNKKENVLKLFLEIKKYSPEFSNDKLEKEKVWRNIFPGTEYNYGIMKNLIFDLNKLAVSYIDLENHYGNKFDSDINILEQYFSRSLLDSFKKKNNEIRKQLSKEKPSIDIFNRIHILGEIELQYLLSNNYNLKNVNKFDFDSLNHNLILRFYSEYFLLNTKISLCQLHYNVTSENSLNDKILDLYLNSEIKNYHTEIFYYVYKCSFNQDDEANYYKLKELYYDNFHDLIKTDKQTVTEALIAFCIYRSAHGDVSFVKERFQYHKILDDYNLYLENYNGKLDGYMFLNTNVTACSCDEFDWAEKFIEKYKSNLEPAESEKLINLAFTHLNFKKKDFEKALQYLSKCDNRYGLDKINIKTYESILYYELRYYEELKNLIDTSKHYIRNDKLISEVAKKMFRNFIDALNKLNEFRCNEEQKKLDISVLREIKDFISGNEMANKGWLFNKLSELENQ